jgi:hypothetical protein
MDTDTGVTNPVAEDYGVDTDVASQDNKAYNFKALRESKEFAERRAIEAERRTAQLEATMAQRQQPQEENVDLDFSDAVDGDALKKVTKFIAQRDKKWEEKLDRLEATYRQSSLKSQDPQYIDVINQYLPEVIASDPTVREIIASTPASKQYDVMYRFATTNPEYVVKRHIDKAKGQGRIEEPPPRTNSLGAVSQGRSPGAGKQSAFSMSHDDFYGPNGYLQQILDGKIS